MSGYNLETNTPPSVVIHLDSRFASSYLQKVTDSSGDSRDLTTNYIYNLREALEINDTMVCLISLHSATIPYSFYNLRTDINDTLTIRVVYNGVTYNNDIQLDQGNYNVSNLLTELVNKVNTLEYDGSHTISNRATITKGTQFDYDRKLMKFAFYYTTTDDLLTQISFLFTSAQNNAGNIMGFYDDGTLYTLTRNGGSTNNLKSAKVVDLNDQIHGLYVRQNLVSKGTLDNATGIFSNILSRIPITTNAGGVIFFSPNDGTHKSMVDLKSIQSIGIKLTDDTNRPLDLNGGHWQVSLQIDYVFRKEPILELTKVSRRIMELSQQKLIEEQQTKEVVEPVKEEPLKTKKK